MNTKQWIIINIVIYILALVYGLGWYMPTKVEKVCKPLHLSLVECILLK